MATYDGTRDDDVLLGGDDDDILRGGAGDDVLEGGAGADEIDGGEDGGFRDILGTFRGAIWGDTATYVHSDAGVTIDLAMGTAQGGHAEGDTLTGIESVRGSDHADMLVARNDNPATPATTEEPPEGSTLYGQKGDDTLRGGTGIDLLWGGKGDDVLMGGANWDYLEGGFGADVIDGGDGFDSARYELSDAGVTIDLATGAAEGGHAEGDTLTGIEGVFGSNHADHLTGDAGHNNLIGADGDDTLDGGAGDDNLQGRAGADLLQGRAGADLLDGGEDRGFVRGNLSTSRNQVWGDTVGYELSDAGVTVNLATGAAAGGHAEGDTLTGIESIRGSDHADVLTARDDDPNTEGFYGDGSTLWGEQGDDVLRGGTSYDVIWGGKGDDTLDGGGSFDYLEGGPGEDVIDGGSDNVDVAGYELSDAGVTVNLAMGTGQGGHAEGDTFTRINSVWGSQHDDHLIGDAGRNLLWGHAGNDTLEGGSGDDILQGDAGADMLDGGEGYDTVRYAGGAAGGSDAGVTVNLADGTGQGGHAEGDTLTGFEALLGSDHADHLTGSTGDNNLSPDYA